MGLRMNEEQALLLQQKKIHGCRSDWTLNFKVIPAPKPLQPQGLVDVECMILPIGWTGYVWIFTELATLQTSQAGVCKVCNYASLIYEPGDKLLFFLQQWPKNALLSLTVYKMWSQQTHKENDVSNYGINFQKIILNCPMTILPMFLAGEFSHKIEAVFAGFEGAFVGL